MGNFIDDIVGFFSPELGLKRIKARFQSDSIRNFELASKSRRSDGWRSSGASADAEISKALPTLRNRMREQDRNNSHAKKAINVIKNNTIGPGIRISIVSKQKKKRVLNAWNDFADEKTCDFDSHLNFYGLQGLVMRTVALSGECLILKNITKYEKDGPIPLKLRVLECDYIDDSKDGVIDANTGNTINQGIEFDKNGKRVAYWLFKEHPGDNRQSDLISQRIPADYVIHVFLKERPGQNRGVPFGTASGITLKDLKDYQDAELLRQKIASCFALFVHDDKDSLSSSTSGSNQQMIDKVEPGIIEHLPPGKTITFASPPKTDGYAEHTKRLLQNVAAGYGITYEALTGDMSLVNFSSGRMGWLEFHRQITDWQLNMMIPMMCDSVFDWFVEIAILAGVLPDEKIKTEWTPPRREMIDPVKEINGLKLQIRNGLISWQEAVRELGYDPDNLLDEISSDMTKLKELGLVLDCDPRNDLKEQKVKK